MSSIYSRHRNAKPVSMLARNDAVGQIDEERGLLCMKLRGLLNTDVAKQDELSCYEGAPRQLWQYWQLVDPCRGGARVLVANPYASLV